MIKLLFVCIANICRSPAAETVMNHLLESHSLQQQVNSDSAGLTNVFFGKAADTTMCCVARKRGYYITGTARPITSLDFVRSDFILAMNNDLVTELRLVAPEKAQHNKILNLCDFCQYLPQEEVPDPYCGNRQDFEFTLDIIEDACNGLISMVKRQIN